jgi:hypothetical protein
MPACIREKSIARRERSKEHEETVLLLFPETISPGEIENVPELFRRHYQI